jgi:molybdate transport repressor ModE-like protein
MTAAMILAADAAVNANGRGPAGDMGGLSAIRRIVTVYRMAGIQKIVVVTGSDAEIIERRCARMGLIFLRAGKYGSGDMTVGLKTGLAYLRDKCARVFVSPAHISLFSLGTVTRLSGAKAPVVVPVFRAGGTETAEEKPREPYGAGYPIILSECLFDRILKYSGRGTQPGALHGEDAVCCFVAVPDKGIYADIREETDLGDLIENQGLKTLRPGLKVNLTTEKAFFGPGTLLLLNLTRETGSLMQASQYMGVSYSKAVKMIRSIEEQIGHKVLEGRKGGNSGGGSAVTEKGRELMARFASFESECNLLVKNAFDKHFDGF